MLVVIQCAAGKSVNAGHDAGHLMSEDGQRIIFVAAPEGAPKCASRTYRRPDDPAPSGRSYRDELVAYNRDRRTENPGSLLPAWKLYKNEAYGRLAETFGTDRLFILSAGWGLIAADFLTPNYDVTFSSSAREENAYKRRSMRDPGWHDFRMIPKRTPSHVVFLGGKDYVPLFCATTAGAARRTVFYNAKKPPDAPGCALRRYETARRTTWYYECARALVDGDIAI